MAPCPHITAQSGYVSMSTYYYSHGYGYNSMVLDIGPCLHIIIQMDVDMAPCQHIITHLDMDMTPCQHIITHMDLDMAPWIWILSLTWICIWLHFHILLLDLNMAPCLHIIAHMDMDVTPCLHISHFKFNNPY